MGGVCIAIISLQCLKWFNLCQAQKRVKHFNGLYILCDYYTYKPHLSDSGSITDGTLSVSTNFVENMIQSELSDIKSHLQKITLNLGFIVFLGNLTLRWTKVIKTEVTELFPRSCKHL